MTMPGREWWPSVVVDDVATEWWLVAPDGRLIATVPYVPGILPNEGSPRAGR